MALLPSPAEFTEPENVLVRFSVRLLRELMVRDESGRKLTVGLSATGESTADYGDVPIYDLQVSVFDDGFKLVQRTLEDG